MMSRSRSATGWSAGATLLAALVGSLAGSAAGVAAAAAGGGVGAAAAGSFWRCRSLQARSCRALPCSGSTLAVSGLPVIGGRRGNDIGLLGLGGLLRRLCRCGRGRGGVGLDDVRLEIVDRRRRDIGGFGARNRGVDRKLGCTVAGRVGLRQCRGRRHREEGRRDGEQYAVVSGTVVRTVTHYLTPWAKLPRRGAARGIVGFTLFARAPA